MKRFILGFLAALLTCVGWAAEPLYQLVGEGPLVVVGTNPPAGTGSILVAGVAASFDPLAPGLPWSRTLTLAAGHHSLALEFRGADGRRLGRETRDVVVESKTLPAGGQLTGQVRWTTNDGIIRITNSVLVEAGGQLTIEPGVVVLFAPNTSLRANNGSLVLNGSEAQPIHLLPADGSTVWGELAVDGAQGLLEARHVEAAAGSVKIRGGAVGLLEDCYWHHYKSGSTPIAGCTQAKSVTVRRCRFNVYYETLWQFTPVLIEDSLFENANSENSDALDFDGAPVGSIIRRCTFQHGPQSNTDAIDIGSGSQGVLIEDCVMWDFPKDKGVSIGEDSFGIVVRNCLMIGCNAGVAVKDDCRASIERCTIVDCDYGLRLYNKANPAASTGGGHVTNAVENVFWNNQTTVSSLNGSTLVSSRNDFGTDVIPGPGNLAADPLFRDRLNLDFRLAAASPCRGLAADGGPLGVRLPVGRPAPAPLILVPSAAGASLDFSALADGFTYLVETAETVDAAEWRTVDRFTATGPAPTVVPPNGTAVDFYRLSVRVP